MEMQVTMACIYLNSAVSFTNWASVDPLMVLLLIRHNLDGCSSMHTAHPLAGHTAAVVGVPTCRLQVHLLLLAMQQCPLQQQGSVKAGQTGPAFQTAFAHIQHRLTSSVITSSCSSRVCACELRRPAAALAVCRHVLDPCCWCMQGLNIIVPCVLLLL